MLVNVIIIVNTTGKSQFYIFEKNGWGNEMSVQAVKKELEAYSLRAGAIIKVPFNHSQRLWKTAGYN